MTSVSSSNYIVNLRDPSHWAALYMYIKDRKKMAYYINSFDDDFGYIPNEIIDFTESKISKPSRLPKEATVANAH